MELSDTANSNSTTPKKPAETTSPEQNSPAIPMDTTPGEAKQLNPQEEVAVADDGTVEAVSVDSAEGVGNEATMDNPAEERGEASNRDDAGATTATQNIAPQQVEAQAQPVDAQPTTVQPASAKPAAAPNDEAQTEEKSRSSFITLPKSAIAVLGLVVALLMAVCVLGGYILGTRNAPDPADAQKVTIAGKQMTFKEIRKLAKKAPAGKAPATPVEPKGGFDATIHGPHGPLQGSEGLMNLARRDEHDPFAIGPVDAPVVITVFSDLECPYCAKFATETEPAIIKDYVDKGLVRIEWNDMAVNGDKAENSAVAARAAAAQGKFREFVDALYAEGSTKQGHPNFGKDDYIRFAQAAGVKDLDRFKKDLDNEKYRKAVEEAREFASGIGVQATPTFVVNMSPIQGAESLDLFEKTIQVELAKVATGEVHVRGTDSAAKAEKK